MDKRKDGRGEPCCPFPTNPLVRGCFETWAQCRSLILSLPLGEYGRPAAGGSSIGAHARHCLDHYASLLDGLEGGVVDYDNRARSPLLETDSGAALSAIDAMTMRLARLDSADLDTPLAVFCACASDGARTCVASSLGRELLFASGHVTHHLALMRLLAEQGGAELPSGIGVAFSTKAHRDALESSG